MYKVSHVFSVSTKLMDIIFMDIYHIIPILLHRNNLQYEDVAIH